LAITQAKSPTIPDQITSPSASQSRGLLSTISGFLTRSPAAKSTSGPKDIPEPGSPTPAAANDDTMAATRRKSVSKSAEPAAEDGEPEVEEDEEDDEDVPEEEYEVDKVIDHRKDAPVSLAVSIVFADTNTKGQIHL
jgi:hypothetical protein